MLKRIVISEMISRPLRYLGQVRWSIAGFESSAYDFDPGQLLEPLKSFIRKRPSTEDMTCTSRCTVLKMRRFPSNEHFSYSAYALPHAVRIASMLDPYVEFVH